MTTFIFILAYLIVIGYIIWYFTSTTDKTFSRLWEIFITILALIPGVHIFAVIIVPILIWSLNYNGELNYKNNWFNRTFLSSNE